MDTVEEISGTYFFNGMTNLSATELYFWVLLDEAGKQLGTDDLVTLALIILGQPIKEPEGNRLAQPKAHHISVHI